MIAYTSAGFSEAPDARKKVDVCFGNIARLQAYALSAQQTTFGQDLDVTLYWEATNDAPVKGGYTVFVYLLDESQRIIAQHDGKPSEGTRPASTWQPADIVPDTHRLVWMVDEYEGKAVIVVGLYDPLTQQRLPAYDSDGERLARDCAVLGATDILK